jgi:hypothetical protein
MDEFGPLNLQPHPGKQWAPIGRGKGAQVRPRRRRRRATYTRPDGALSHNGEWAGFLTNFRVSADHRIAVAVSCNRVADRSPSDIEGITDQLRTEWAEA